MPKAIAAILLIGICSPGTSLAQPGPDKKTLISLGAFITDQDMATAFDSTFGDGTDLDFEQDLGLDTSLSVFRFDASHRFGSRHRLVGSIFDLSRESTVDITGEIEWRDTVFPISTRLTTDFDFTIYKLAYVYEFMQREDWYVGASIGVYTADITLELRNENTQEAEAGDLTAPLPVVGLRGTRRLGERWSLSASGELFFASFDNVDGLLYDVSVGVDYWFSNNVALGLALNGVELDVDARRKRLSADLVWSYSGALLALKVGF